MTEWYGPRERVLELGAKTVCDEELLGVLLRTGPRSGTDQRPGVLQLATALYARFGGLEGVFKASPEELREVTGIGPSKAAILLAVGEIFLRIGAAQSAERDKICGPEDAFRIFSDLTGEAQEVVCAAFLDSQNQLIRRKEIFRGTIDASLAQPREILREALRSNAARLVIAHNHPSGSPQPSEEDRQFTERVYEACALVGVTLLDHVIVCPGGQSYSFARESRTAPFSSFSPPEQVLPRTSKKPGGRRSGNRGLF